METKFVADHDLPYYRALAAERFGDIDDDDWWCTFAGYDVNVWYEESTGAFKATLYRYDKERGTLTDRWQSLGIIKHKQKGKDMETISQQETESKSLHADLLRIGALERQVEGLRARIDRDVANFDRFTRDVNGFLNRMVDEYDLEETDSAYSAYLKEWVDRDVLTNPFRSEVTYKVTVNATKVLEIRVKHPSNVGDIDVEDMLENELGEVDGDEDSLSDYLDDDHLFEITDISIYSRDVEIEAQAK